MIIAKFIERVAIMGAGFLSLGSSYQPNIPEELKIK
jgi:cyclic lactone autoinducer peptide